MRRAERTISALWRPVILVVGLMLIGAGGANASPLSVVKPVMACGDLLKLDLSYLKEAPTTARRSSPRARPRPIVWSPATPLPPSRSRSACRPRRGPSEW
jgi:hypothetical protein